MTTGNTLKPLSSAYSGTEYHDSNTGLTLGQVFCAFAPITVTAVRFWRVSTDDATSRTVAIYNSSGTAVATGSSSGETPFTSGWRTITLTTPLVLSGAGLSAVYVAAVFSPYEYYPATAAGYQNGFYSADSKAYGLSSSEAQTAGVVGNGLFHYGATMVMPDGTYGQGDYWVDIVYSYADAGGVSVNVTGASLTASGGTVTANGKASTSVTGSVATTSAGTVTVTANRFVSTTLTGAGLAITAGTVTATGRAFVSTTVSGASLTASAGGVNVTTPATTLNPLDKKDANVVLSNANMTSTGIGAANNWVRSTRAATGKRYVEFTANTVANSIFGIADKSSLVYPGDDPGAFGLFANGAGSINGTFPYWGTPFVTGNVVGMAVDLVAKKVWWRVNGGVWNGNTDNPATNTGGFDISAYTGTPHYVIVSGDMNSVVTVNFGASAFGTAIPSGFVSWDFTAVTQSIIVTGAAVTATAGTVSVVASQPISTTVTGVGLTTTAGSVTVNAVIAAPVSVNAVGSVATTAAGTVSVTANRAVSTTVSGSVATTSAGTVTAGVSVTAPITSTALGATAGTVSVVAKASTSVTGSVATTAGGSVTVVAKASATVTVTSAALAATNGTVTVSTPAPGISVSAPVTSTALATTAGTVSVTVGTGVLVNVTGQSMATLDGTATAAASATVFVDGQPSYITPGDVSTYVAIRTPVTSPTLTSSRGTVTVKAAARVTVTGQALAVSPGTVTTKGAAKVAISSVQLTASGGTASVTTIIKGGVKVWDGTKWVMLPVKAWTGSAWLQKPMKTWTGSAWIAK